MRLSRIKNLSQQYGTYLFLLLAISLVIIPSSTASFFSTKQISPLTDSRGGWKLQDSGTTDNLNGVFFKDSKTGLVVGGLWDHALILHTSNGGNIWSQERDDDPAPAELLAVSFSDGKNGMAVGYYGTIMSTRTGGASWNAIQTYFMNTYFGAYMYNQTIGFAVGVSNIFYPLVTRTTDGWQTFEHFSFPIKNNDELWEADLTDVEFISPTVGFATARVAYGHGAIIYTADAGETWKTVYWNNDGNILGIEFVSEDIGYAVGDRGLILKTDDGGQHWGRLHSGVFFRLHDVSFASKEVGTAVGDNGFILRTMNAGRTWFWQYSGTVASLHAIQLINEKEGFIVGENGIILHTTNGGIPS